MGMAQVHSAEAYLATLQYDKAIETFQQIATLDPDLGARSTAQVVETYRQAKNYAKAEEAGDHLNVGQIVAGHQEIVVRRQRSHQRVAVADLEDGAVHVHLDLRLLAWHVPREPKWPPIHRRPGTDYS